MGYRAYGEEHQLRSCGMYSPRLCGGRINWCLSRNVPGVALYMTSLTQIRSMLARNGYFTVTPPQRSSSVLPALSSQGNLLAGATARVGVGFLLNPFSVLKARFEVRPKKDVLMAWADPSTLEQHLRLRNAIWRFCVDCAPRPTGTSSRFPGLFFERCSLCRSVCRVL
jgi:hypothetical protein